MKNKLLILSLLTSAFAVGCSEGAYTPTTGVPINNTGIYPQNQMYPYNNQPFNQTPTYQNVPFQNTQNMMYPQYQQQNMLSWSMRLRLPGFYYNNYAYRSCIPRRPYTTTCNQRIVRNPCPYVRSTTTDTSVDTSTETNVVTDTQPVAVVTDSHMTTDTSVTVDPTPAEGSTKVYPISWKEEDAKAIYERLAKEEETIEKDRFLNKGVKARTGENIKCIVDGKRSNKDNYVCDVEIRAKDGMLLQQVPISKNATPEIADNVAYKGDLLTLGNPGQAPEVGYLVVAGPVARELFNNLGITASEGTVEEAGNIAANIKTLGQVKCYQTINTTKTVNECILKIETNTGKALNF